MVPRRSPERGLRTDRGIGARAGRWRRRPGSCRSPTPLPRPTATSSTPTSSCGRCSTSTTRTRSSGASSTRHVMSPAVPSDTDVGLAAYPDALYLICSLANADTPGARLVHPRRRRERGRAGHSLSHPPRHGAAQAPPSRSSATGARAASATYSPMSSFQTSGWSRMKSSHQLLALRPTRGSRPPRRASAGSPRRP